MIKSVASAMVSQRKFRLLQRVLFERARRLSGHSLPGDRTSAPILAWGHYVGGDSSDLVERAQWTDQHFQNAIRQQVLDSQVSQVGPALDRLNRGTYGFCVCCGQSIPQERLRLFPETPLCCPCMCAQGKKRRPSDLEIAKLVPSVLDPRIWHVYAEAAVLHWRYAPDSTSLSQVWDHSVIVGAIARQLLEMRPELGLDRLLVLSAALYHDIGVYRLKPPHHARKNRHEYLRHGVIGGRILRYEHLPPELIGVAERHTGAGIARVDIRRENLPLPPRNYVPKSLLEELICYADKFHSKSRGFMTLLQARDQLEEFGPAKVDRFMKWSQKFGVPDPSTIHLGYIARD